VRPEIFKVDCLSVFLTSMSTSYVLFFDIFDRRCFTTWAIPPSPCFWYFWIEHLDFLVFKIKSNTVQTLVVTTNLSKCQAYILVPFLSLKFKTDFQSVSRNYKMTVSEHHFISIEESCSNNKYVTIALTFFD
jgi:hypothetical protein